jgi:formate dehydrogenase iron-sulfur subunit
MSEAICLYVARETSALSVGAEEVLDAILKEGKKRGLSFDVVRTGSRGVSFLEPLIEIGVDRCLYGPLETGDVEGLFDAGFETGGGHKKRIGPADEVSYLRDQTRLVFSRAGLGDPLDLDFYRGNGGFAAWAVARELAPDQVLKEVEVSGLRGRGGAGFPTEIKLRTVRDAVADEKFVVCNADEGDAGTFSDRLLMEADPFCLIEGMLIAAHITGASQGYIYLRSEYPLTRKIFAEALFIARREKLLGLGALGPDREFDIELRIGAGSYVCGEETALLESLEGKRGQVRVKPPLPAHIGLFGKPTLVNNVITLASLTIILANGGEAFAALGVGRSRGTMPVQLGGNVKRGGLVEVPFGISLRDLVVGYGGGTRSGRPVKAVQIGGPLGVYLPLSGLDVALDYEALADVGGALGHGGIIVFDDTVDMAEQARFAFEFCAIESCGKCTPCRIGSVRGVEVMDKIIAGKDRDANLVLIEDLCETLSDGSLCAMGGLTPGPVRSALKYFPEDFS